MAARWATMTSGMIGAVVLAGCAAPAGTTTVPEPVGTDAAVVDKVAAGVGPATGAPTVVVRAGTAATDMISPVATAAAQFFTG